MHLVYLEQEIELLALVTARGEFALNVFDDVLNLRVVGIHKGSLEGAGKEGVGKISGIGRAAGAHGDEAGQVLVFRAQSVKYPAANGRPAVGSWVLYGLGTENQNLPGFITMSPGGAPDARNFTNAFLPGAFQGTFVDSNNAKIEDIIKNIKSEFASRRDQRKQLDLLLKINEVHKQKRQAEGDLEARINSFELAYRMQTDAREAFDIAGEKPETVAKYGANAQGRQMLIARRLLERGVRFVQVRQGGWDLHGGIAQRAANNARQLDPAIGAIMDDLKDRGLFEDTLIYITSEFGRSPTEDGGGGRSHNARGLSTVLMGGGIKGGIAYGSTDEIGGAAVENKVHVKDIHATVMDLLGFDHEQLTYRTAGRDFRLTQATRSLPQGGMPVKGIIA